MLSGSCLQVKDVPENQLEVRMFGHPFLQKYIVKFPKIVSKRHIDFSIFWTKNLKIPSI
jgi:hypothetical protein